MKQSHRSRTAEGAAAMRASHVLYADPIIFADPFAASLVSYPWQRALKNPILHRIIFGVFMRPLLPIQGQVLARARFTEERLMTAIAQGVKQIVVIGAGLDTFCLRHPELAEQVQVYEIDHSASQQFKKRRLIKNGLGIPANLEFISANLERENLAHALRQSNYNPDQPSFFYWLGVTVYLTREAIFQTLESVAEIAGNGSELVFDYAGAVNEIPKEEQANIRLLRFYTERFGEPIIDNQFKPLEFTQQVSSLGFKLMENMSPDEQNQCYFLNRADRLRPVSGSYFAHFRLEK